jgi:hypothetical protein
MYRVIAIVGAALALASCTSNSEFANFNNFFQTGPVKEPVRFESQPPGATATTSTNQSCMTPCALAMVADKPFTVTFTLNGYQPDTEQVQMFSMGDGTSKLRPNPVLVALTPVPPPKKPKRRVHHHRRVAKPKPKPKSVAKPKAPVAAPATTSAPQPQATSPWPAAPSSKTQQ